MDAKFYGIRPRLVTHPPRAPSPSIGAVCRLVHNVVKLIVITCKCTYDRERERHGPNRIESNLIEPERNQPNYEFIGKMSEINGRLRRL